MMIIFYGLLMISAASSVVLLLRVVMVIHQFTRRQKAALPDDFSQLPTVSVCIPARNEMHAMTQCLERVVASDYPKLEILVLDDESKDNTSILIKSFAHSGVRFVEGVPLPEGWLGKTHAKHNLYKEASGDVIFYLDVDTHIKPETIHNMVAILLTEKATMLSILPTRDDIWRASILFATLRYFWTVVFHRPSMPAVASSAWMIRRNYLRDTFGGFERLRMAVEPERLIAAELAKTGGYRFYVSAAKCGVSYEKKWRSQLETSIRLMYPFLKGRIEAVVAAYIILGILLLPFIWVPTALLIDWTLLHSLAFATGVVLLACYVIYTTRVWHRGWLIGGIIFPLILIQELFLLSASIYAYATRRVTWKGRPITSSVKAVVRPVKH